MVYKPDEFQSKIILLLDFHQRTSTYFEQLKGPYNSTMSGNILLLLIILCLKIVLASERNTLYRQADIRGGLLFEKDVDTPRIINPNYLAYKRKLDMKQVMTSVELTQKFINVYKTFCESIQNSVDTGINVRAYSYRHKFYLAPGLKDISTAKTECKAIGTDVPEIRTKSELKDLVNFARENDVKDVNINIYYDNRENILRYGSDNTSITNVLQNFLIENPNSPTLYTRTNVYDYLARPQWQKGKLAYMTIVDKEPLIKNFLTDVKGPYANIICKKRQAPTVERDNTFLLDMAAHMCDRDFNQLKGMTDVVGREAALFLSKEDDSLVIDTGSNNECPSITIFNQQKVNQLKRDIHHKARLVATRANYPVDVTRKYLIFKALALHTQEEFRKFLETDFKRVYLNLNPTQTLLYNLACQFEIETEKLTVTKGANFDRFFELNVDIEMESIYTLINIITSPISIIRQKRSPSISLKTPSLPDASSLFSQSNFGYMLGIATVNDVKRTYDLIAKNAIALGDISVNQVELQTGYNNLVYEIQTLQNVSTMQDIAVMSLTSVLDNRNVITQLHNTIRQSLLIIANAITTASAGNISPYILSERELISLARDLKDKNMFLTTDLKDIHTSVYKIDNEYHFILSIPVVDNKFLYRVYNVRNFPIFSTSELTSIVEPDLKYLAISVDTTLYAELTELEYTQCIEHSFCKIASPIGSINTEASCVARTFKDRQMVCPAVDTKHPQPFFATYGNKTFFSTPLNFEGSLVCPTKEARGDAEPVTGKIKFSGVGTIYLKPTCFVHLPDGRTVAAQFETSIATDLGVSTMNEAFKYSPSLDNYTFTKQHVSIFADQELPDLEITRVEVNSANYITELGLDPNEVTKHLVRLAIILAIAAVMFAILYCTVPKFRRWVKTCCLLRPPTKYWHMQGYEYPIFFKKMKAKFDRTSGDGSTDDSGLEQNHSSSSGGISRIFKRQNNLYRERMENCLKEQEEREQREEFVKELNMKRAEYMMKIREPLDLSDIQGKDLRNMEEPAYAIPASCSRGVEDLGYLPMTPLPRHVNSKIINSYNG